MEKDDEVKGEGNSYTTEFRQYDSRVGRWLSLDPIIKPYMSSYISFRNSPNIYIDPRGNDDIFDRNGKFLFSTSRGTEIKILNEGVTKKQAKKNMENIQGMTKVLSDVDFSPENKKNHVILKGIFIYYSKEMNIKYRKKNKIDYGVYEKDDDSELAHFDKESWKIEIGVDSKGNTPTILNDIGNFKSTIVHEAFHEKDENPSLLSHVNFVIYNQIIHSSFKETTTERQYGVMGYTITLLNKAIKSGTPIETAITIANKINDTDRLPENIIYNKDTGKMSTEITKWDGDDSTKSRMLPTVTVYLKKREKNKKIIIKQKK
jgi:RHS repeat-associated protein